MTDLSASKKRRTQGDRIGSYEAAAQIYAGMYVGQNEDGTVVPLDNGVLFLGVATEDAAIGEQTLVLIDGLVLHDFGASHAAGDLALPLVVTGSDSDTLNDGYDGGVGGVVQGDPVVGNLAWNHSGTQWWVAIRAHFLQSPTTPLVATA